MRGTLHGALNRNSAKAAAPFRTADILSALSHALDLAEGQPRGHAQRACVIGMRVAEFIRMNEADRAHLFYALLLKDAGCSSNAARMYQILLSDEIAAKRAGKTIDWRTMSWENVAYAASHVSTGEAWWRRMLHIGQSTKKRSLQHQELMQIRTERGSAIALELGFSDQTSAAIRHSEEHWDGGGYPDRLAGDMIPLAARIVNLAQTLEVFSHAHGAKEAAEVARTRSGRWFDPELASVGARLFGSYEILEDLAEAPRRIGSIAPLEEAAADRVNQICRVFASVVDTKSPYTSRHSSGVAEAAAAIGRQLDLPAAEVTILERGGWLHDIGKLAVPNSILEKPGRLNAEDWDAVRDHPRIGQEILARVDSFEPLAQLAGTHHERLNGEGYHRGLAARDLSQRMRIMAVADVYDALAADRPYRPGMPLEQVFALLESDPLDQDCVRALKESLQPETGTRADLSRLRESVDESRNV
jgi:HD-GYP domain-containing protein (c-di-GMP phosphodiesterase class II)